MARSVDGKGDFLKLKPFDLQNLMLCNVSQPTNTVGNTGSRKQTHQLPPKHLCINCVGVLQWQLLKVDLGLSRVLL